MFLDPDLDSLARRLAPGGRLLDARALSGGISAGMTLLEIERADGSRLRAVLRVPGAAAKRANPNAARDEFAVLQALQAAGVPVPAPLLLDELGGYLVEAWVDGQPRFAFDDLAGAMRQAAKALAGVHALSIGQSALPVLPRIAPVLDALHLALPVGRRGALDISGIQAAAAGMVERAPANPPALLHGDYWPGNWLWQGERLAGVIDWEDAALGDPLYDLAICRLDLRWIVGREAMEAFTVVYLGERLLDTLDLPRWDLVAALRLARLVGDDLDGWAAFFPPYGRSDISAESIRRDFADFIEKAIRG